MSQQYRHGKASKVSFIMKFLIFINLLTMSYNSLVYESTLIVTWLYVSPAAWAHLLLLIEGVDLLESLGFLLHL